MLQTLLTLYDQGIDTILVTVAATRGSTPTTSGQKLIATLSGLHSGTIGGGKIEAHALAHAKSILLDTASPPCDLQTWNLKQDIGMTCGGEMTLLFELKRSTPPWHILIFGAGHIVQALVPILLTLPCQLTVIDTRPDWLRKLPSQENFTTLLVLNYLEAIPLVTRETQVLAITQGHSTDLPILIEIFKTRPNLNFLGVIGSPSKRATLARELREAGIPAPFIEMIHCPLGLPIGNNTPPEIAISIAAQLLQLRH
ncbi:MAG: XdhC family protein [Armatimonadetes bacterium]|nr:XdhC family protein [Akkermansiaceae bacterium]